MYMYLKNMANYKHNQLKNISFKESQMLFNNTIKWIKAFIPMDTELMKGSEYPLEGSKKAEEGSSKRAGSNLKLEDAKRQRIEKENESLELKRCLEIIPKDDDDTKLLIKKLKDSNGKHQVYGRIVGIKRLYDDVRFTTAQNEEIIVSSQYCLCSVSVSGVQGYYYLQQKLMLQVEDNVDDYLNFDHLPIRQKLFEDQDCLQDKD
nr:hypothetical protein [Tanacetum cinerariifolium]